MGDERPALGFEYEVALAKINTSGTLTFAETPYPTITGTFEIITCTEDVRIVPPVKQVKALVCGYNPAAQLIPAPTIPGRFSFQGLDKAKANAVAAYNGELCVARVITRIDDTVVRTEYVNYLNLSLDRHAPSGDSPGTVSGDGMFTDLVKV